MFVSCLMPTYAKYVNPQLDFSVCVEEAIESFLRQTYTDSELVIFNDQESLMYRYWHPRVRVYNIKGRFKSLGHKRNAMVHAARGEICALWDDDDISYPERLENIVNAFTENPELSLVGSGNVMFSTNNTDYQLEYIGDPGRSPSVAFRKQAVVEVPYRDLSFGEDFALWGDLGEAGHQLRAYRAERPDFIYRWGMGVWHASWNLDNNYERISQQNFKEYVCHLEPHWANDYEAERVKLESA